MEFIVAERGTGKSWIAHLICKVVSSSGKLGEWQAASKVPVLYVDGEMPFDLMRERDRGLGDGELIISTTQFCSKEPKRFSI